jgi:hypothetical protein
MAYSQYKETPQFSGVVEKSYKGKAEATKVYVKGKEVLSAYPTRRSITGNTRMTPTTTLKSGEKAELVFPGQTVTITNKSIQSTPNTVQRQNVINEYEAIRRDQSLVLQSKQKEVDAFRFVDDSNRPLYTKNGGITEKGFPVGTSAEATRALQSGGSLFGLEPARTPQQLGAVVEDMSYYSQASGYNPIQSMGNLQYNQQLFADIKAARKAYKATEQQAIADSMQSSQFPQSKDYNALLKQSTEKELELVKGTGKNLFESLDKDTRLRLAISDVGVGISKLSQETTIFTEKYLFGGFQNQYSTDTTSFTFDVAKNKIYPGFLGDVQRSNLGLTGNIAYYGSIGLTAAQGTYQGYKLFQSEKALGLTNLQAANRVGGQLLEGLSPVQLTPQKTLIISSKTSPNLQVNMFSPNTPLKTISLGKANKYGVDLSLSTSKGVSQTLSKTEIKYLSLYKPNLVEFSSPSYLKTGSLTAFGEVRSLNYFNVGQTFLKPENVAATRQINEKTFRGIISGTRESDLYTSKLIQSDRYTLGLQKQFIREIQTFKGTSDIRIIKQEGEVIGLSISKSQLNIKPIEKQTFFLNNKGKVLGYEFIGKPYNPKGYGLSGRPSIIRGTEAYMEIKPSTGKPYGKIDFGNYEVKFGKSLGLGKARGKKFILGFNTEFYSPKKDYFSIKIEDKPQISFIDTTKKVPYSGGKSLGDIGALGGYERTKDTIYIDKSLSKIDAKDIIKHEMGHRFAYQTGAENLYRSNNLKSDILSGKIKSDVPARLKLAGYPDSQISKEYLADIFSGAKLTKTVNIPSSVFSSQLKTLALTPNFNYPKFNLGTINVGYNTRSLLLLGNLGYKSNSDYGLKFNSPVKTNSLSLINTSQVNSVLSGLDFSQSTRLGSAFRFGSAIPLMATPLAPGFNFGLTPTFTPPRFPGIGEPLSLGGFTIPNVRGKGRKTGTFDIAPSFTGLTLGIRIKSPVKASKTFGVTPFQRRGIYKGKGPYSRLTNI